MRFQYVAWLAPLLASTGCIHAYCNAVCEDLVFLQSTLSVTADALSGAQVQFCRNGNCATGTADTVAPGTLYLETVFTAATFQVEFTAEQQTDGSTLAGFSYRAETGDKAYVNGDVYSATIVSASGSTLLTSSSVAHYATMKDCFSDTCHNFAGTL